MSAGLDRDQLVRRLVLSARLVLLEHSDDGAGRCSGCKARLAECGIRTDTLALIERHDPPRQPAGAPPAPPSSQSRTDDT